MVLPQPLLIVFCLLLPTIFFISKKPHLLAAWAAIACSIDIFNSQKYMNLSAIKIFGIIAIPYVFSHYKILYKTRLIQLLAMYFLYLTALGIWYGYLFPWIDPTGLKTGRDVPHWRSVLHLGSFFLELTSALCLALIFRDKKNQKIAVFTLITTVMLSCLAGIIESFTHFDFYHFFTGDMLPINAGRVRGFNYEPRGLAQSTVYALLAITCLYKTEKHKLHLLIWFLPLLIFGGLYLPISLTATLTLGCGLGIIFLLYFQSIKKVILAKKPILLGILFILTGLIIFVLQSPHIRNHFYGRRYLFEMKSPIQSLEVFDAAAVNFFVHNPAKIIFGAGPGMVSIPSSAYILERDKGDWGDGITALPHMGAVLQFSNGGILGLIFWLFTMTRIARLNLRAGIQGEAGAYRALSVVFLSLYFLQIRPHFIIGLGLGLSILLEQSRFSHTAQYTDCEN